MIQLYLPIPRYNEIKYEVLFMYEECEIETFPIDCFEIARRLYYHLVPYSCLPDHALRLAMQYSPDGFSTIIIIPILECMNGTSFIMIITVFSVRDGQSFMKLVIFILVILKMIL